MATTQKQVMRNKDLAQDRGLSPQSITEHYAHFRKLLLHRRNELLRHADLERSQVDKQILESPGDVGDLSVVDTSTDYYLTLADNDRRELNDIRDAIDRMRRGVYGICENCENEITPERLEKLPQARRCIDCQSMLETKFRASRPMSTPKL